MADVPEIVRNKVRALGADKWLADLDALLEEYVLRWNLTLGDTYGDATEAFVCDVLIEEREPGVLKILIPRGGAVAHEITVLELANGEGCVKLLRHDAGDGVLLLERLGANLFSLGLPIEERLEILCATVAPLWRPAVGSGLPTGAQKARWLADFITTTWESLNHPCSERVITHALSCAQRRVNDFDQERAVLVHGDVHQWNTLISGDGFKLVDPDGLHAEAEYDLGVLMREDPIELLHGDPFDRAHWLARRCNLDACAIWEWGVVERVSTGLLATQVGLEPLGSQMLSVAEVVARRGDAP